MVDTAIHLKHLEFIAIFSLSFWGAALMTKSYKKLTTAELINKCIETSHGSSQAWDEFKSRFDRHIQLILYKTYVKYYNYNNSDEINETLKDLKQDVYIKLLDKNCEGLKNFKGDPDIALKAYLRVIAKNLVINFVNRHKKRFINDDNLDGKVNLGTSIDFEAQHLKESVFKLLKKYYHSRNFARDAVIFWLFYFEGFTSKELATKFNLSASGIETLVARMKKVLIKNYKKIKDS